MKVLYQQYKKRIPSNKYENAKAFRGYQVSEVYQACITDDDGQPYYLLVVMDFCSPLKAFLGILFFNLFGIHCAYQYVLVAVVVGTTRTSPVLKINILPNLQ